MRQAAGFVRLTTGACVVAVLLALGAGSAAGSAHYAELVAPDTGAIAFSVDGSVRVFTTSAALAPEDTDSQIDVYRQAGGQTTLVSVGPNGGNGAFDAALLQLSKDGSHVVFQTAEPLVAADTDSTRDWYLWSSSGVQLVTTTSAVDPQTHSVGVGAASDDGSVLYLTSQDFQFGAGVSLYRFTGGQLSGMSITSPRALPNAYGPFTGFCGASPDGSTAYIRTYENIDPTDTDPGQGPTPGYRDVYRIVGSTATLISAPAGGLVGLRRGELRPHHD